MKKFFFMAVLIFTFHLVHKKLGRKEKNLAFSFMCFFSSGCLIILNSWAAADNISNIGTII